MGILGSAFNLILTSAERQIFIEILIIIHQVICPSFLYFFMHFYIHGSISSWFGVKISHASSNWRGNCNDDPHSCVSHNTVGFSYLRYQNIPGICWDFGVIFP